MDTETAKKAARLHSSMNLFAAVATLLEGGLLYESDSYSQADKIIKICKKEQQQLIKKYDRLMEG